MQTQRIEAAAQFKALTEAVHQRKRHHHPKFISISLVLGLLCVLALDSGAVQVSILQWFVNQNNDNPLVSMVLWEIRLPRLLMTMATGAGLALCGTVLQAICKNPLADPGIIGVSTSAALFAGTALALLGSSVQLPPSLAAYFVPLSAFIGAVLSLMLLIKIADSPTGMNTLVLILAGVAINAGAMALLSIVQYLVDDATLRQISFWSMGSYAGINIQVFLITLIPLVLSVIYFWRVKDALMLVSCSEKQAKYQGVNINKLKMNSLFAVAALVAVCVSFTGIVAFVGLVVPHICRMFIGAHLRLLIPSSMLCGAFLVTAADTLARTIIIPEELPIGLLTSLVGVPFFLYLVIREKKRLHYV